MEGAVWNTSRNSLGRRSFMRICPVFLNLSSNCPSSTYNLRGKDGRESLVCQRNKNVQDAFQAGGGRSLKLPSTAPSDATWPRGEHMISGQLEAKILPNFTHHFANLRTKTRHRQCARFAEAFRAAPNFGRRGCNVFQRKLLYRNSGVIFSVNRNSGGTLPECGT